MVEGHDGKGEAMCNPENITGDAAACQAAGAGRTAALNAALESGDLGLIMGTLGEMARAHRMRRVAQETGLGRESLYKSMRAGSSPEFATVLKVLRSLGFRFEATPIAGDDGQQRNAAGVF